MESKNNPRKLGLIKQDERKSMSTYKFSPGQTSACENIENITFKVACLGSALAWVGLGVRSLGEDYDWNRENLEATPQRALYFNHVLKWIIVSLQSSVGLGKSKVCCLQGQQALSCPNELFNSHCLPFETFPRPSRSSWVPLNRL